MKALNFLHALNDEQIEAVFHTDSPLMVVAGPGSGKTRVITCKVAYLIRQKRIPPERILAITFTKKATNEMQNRVYNFTGIQSRWISTFHSLCYKIVSVHRKECGLFDGDFTVYDEDASMELFKKACQLAGVDPDKIEDLKQAISYHKQFGNVNPDVFMDEQDKKAFHLYEKMLLEASAVDYDNLQVFAWRILKNPAIREKWMNTFDYLLIDEFQDTSLIQYEIAKSLLKNGNITVVGDPQQGIYSFRGANIENVIKFAEEYSPSIIKLPLNYRSCTSVVNVANAVSSFFDEQYRKYRVHIKSVISEKGYVDLKSFQTQIQEARWIAHQIKFLKESIEPEKIAILVRARYVNSPIKEQLLNSGIAFDDLTNYDLFDRAEIKDLLSYLNLAYNPKDTVSFMRAVQTPKRGIAKETIKKIEQYKKTDYIQAMKDYINFTKGAKTNALYGFLRLIEHIRDLLHEPLQALNEVISLTGYMNFIKNKEDYENRYASIQDLKLYMSEYKSYKDFIENCMATLTRKDRKAVKIMTIHAAKGLEFDAVFVPALEKGVFPNEKADLEEEKRCFYVAVTRAKKYLFLTAHENKISFDGENEKIYPVQKSIFWYYLENALEEMQEEKQVCTTI